MLLNVALHGLEEAAGARYRKTGPRAGITMPGAPVLVRYADDFAVCCQSRQQAEQIKARLAEWLQPRGLAINEDKTRIVHLVRGVRLPGVQHPPLRSQAADQTEHGGHQAAPETARDRDAQRCAARTRGRSSPGSTRSSGVGPPTTGRRCPAGLLLAGHLHVEAHLQVGQTQPPEQVEDWIGRPLLRQVQQVQERPVGVRRPSLVSAQGDVAHLIKFSWTNIVRHQTVNGTASPDDPALTEYWAARRRRIKPPLDSYTLRLLDRQDSRCPLCGDPVLTADQPPGSPQQWERLVAGGHPQGHPQHDYLVHHGRPARPGNPDGDQTRLVHASCQRALRARHRRSTAHPTLRAPAACLSRVRGKPARTVLRGPPQQCGGPTRLTPTSGGRRSTAEEVNTTDRFTYTDNLTSSGGPAAKVPRRLGCARAAAASGGVHDRVTGPRSGVPVLAGAVEGFSIVQSRCAGTAAGRPAEQQVVVSPGR